LLFLFKYASVFAFVSMQHSGRSATSLSVASKKRLNRAANLIDSLVQADQCFTTEEGAYKFQQACAANVLIEDRFFTQPFVGKTVSAIYESVMHLPYSM
jgi:hypothetical protein